MKEDTYHHGHIKNIINDKTIRYLVFFVFFLYLGKFGAGGQEYVICTSESLIPFQRVM